MKLDIGKGKILGTKEVSSNGQISGFTEYAGREVLVVLPESDTEVEPDAREMLEEITTATRQHMKVAFDEYEQIKDRFRGPGDATRAFLDEHAPRSFKGLYDRVEAWVQEQASGAEDRVREAIRDEQATDTGPTRPSDSPTPQEGSI